MEVILTKGISRTWKMDEIIKSIKMLMTELWVLPRGGSTEGMFGEVGRNKIIKNTTTTENKGNVNTIYSKTSIHFVTIFFMPAFWLP